MISASLQAVALLSVSLYTQFAVAEPGVMHLSLEKRLVQPDSFLSRRLRKRSGEDQEALQNQDIAYLANVTVGTPGQTISLQLDTGSSDVWFPGVDSAPCKQGLCVVGSFDPTKSSSYTPNVIDAIFNISYVDGTVIQGNYFNDTLSVGSASLKEMTMGLGSEINWPGGGPVYGILGVSYQSEEAIAAQSGENTVYQSFIDQLVDQGVIATKAYSLWLNDPLASDGNILFGGVDTTKYSGSLTAIPLQIDDDSGFIHDFAVPLVALQVTGNGGSTVFQASPNVDVILDSGTSLTYVPEDIGNAIISGVGAEQAQGGYVVDCGIANTGGVFKFQFGNTNGPIISVGISHFVDTQNTATVGGVTKCGWGLQPTNAPPLLFGDTFLRNAYVVYNLDGNQVAIAQANYNVSSSSIAQITAATAIPDVSSTAVGTGLTAEASTINVTPGTWNLGTASAGSANGGTSTPKKGGAVAAVSPSTPFTGAIVAGLTILFSMVGGSLLILM